MRFGILSARHQQKVWSRLLLLLGGLIRRTIAGKNSMSKVMAAKAYFARRWCRTAHPFCGEKTHVFDQDLRVLTGQFLPVGRGTPFLQTDPVD